ncbi:MAG: UPF0262 family protein [Rhodospirillaceae bacterium]|jgi:uncharacterized protein (UPF0262 family)|nr:UPF0262 family protein [Rhodospirillaceae bacterium]MBT4428315.1 UPF0262 family protein [Rhodospirillaceae bacterium]MBT5039744.1 UPF0262 family protein [Rhodospirillaceae bacterium]MBT7293291.1 UPF0262 family protein [Rhodospirillaceae bacterium]
MTEGSGDERLAEIDFEEGASAHPSPDVAQERRIAIYDLLEKNHFSPADGGDRGPYALRLKIVDNRLILALATEAGEALGDISLSMSPFRSLMKDYATVCESYFEAIKTAPRARIEAIDMGRRGLHDEGSELLRERLKGDAELDFDTARRLFTLIYVLHMRG